ncbi:TonB-linked SusC/RagA family outer membrane protein [Flavobacterium sp. 7E]|uniref:SusC/RagA family TonB-linked outer membrane protein n=1 Tax=unclassified Flavobacterium TaxID=196869 RepID=UPI001570FAAA|nr:MULTISPECIES: TonB-dependent receptor [unclassified Flavobacterium]MBE0393477.1 TonB-dependent receptor SusC [Flavobacterium sp. PL002]NRS88851.1 TonB-linked SusC/RagA family outer membrane protein [Flavobacterium sp. 7E]
MNLKIKLSLLVILLFNVAVFAQKKYTVTGKVTASSDKLPIPGANLIVTNSKAGTVTDFDGAFSISVTSGDKLQFSYLGYETKTIVITNQTVLNVSLTEAGNQLEQVVVIGYGTQKRANVTGSISKVTNTDLDQIPVSRVDDALIGQVAGVNIQQTNPGAGEAPTIKVRGQGSISFSSNPLIVVDGIVVGTDADFLSSLDMNDVESVEILKDASSSSIYGSRGANGVVMVTTKKGKEGPTKFSYNTYTGYKFVPRTNILSTPDKWAQYVSDNNGGELTDQMKYIQKLGTYTNWEKEIMDGGIITDHNLSISGGSANTKFRTSIGYNSDEGVLLNDNYKKLNLRLNLDSKADNLEFGVMINPSFTKQRRFPINLVDAIRQSPWLPVYLDENSIQYVNRLRENGRWANAQVGDYAMERMFDNYDLVNGVPLASGGTSISATSNQNSYAKVNEINEEKFQTKFFANAYFKYNITDHFNFKQTLGGDYRFVKSEEFRGVQATRNGAADSGSFYNSSEQTHIVTESLFSYSNDFGKHNLSAIAGFTTEHWSTENVGLSAAGYTNDYIQTIPAANLTGGSTSEYKEKLISYLSRVNYSYDDRYLLAVSFRTDGSSKFGPDKKFGFFPAASVGWRISNEKFLAGSNFVRDLKLRASYGVTGSNSGIGEYDYIGLVQPVGTGLDGVSNGFNTTNISNPNLGWEQLVEFNPGIDASIFGGIFSFSFDYYTRTSKDLLIDLPVAAITGFETALVNRGEVKNEGFELELRSKNIKTKNFSWTSSALFTRNKNTLVDFAGSSGLISIIDDKRPSEWISLEGHPISSFYGYVVSSQIDKEFIKNPFYPINAQAQDVYVKDINGDGVIDTDDRTILGTPYPDLVWSFSNNFKYKNIDLSFMLQGSFGAEVRNINSQYINNEFASNQDSTSDLPNPEFTTQRIFTSDDVQDASYVALRNVNLGYTFSKDMVKKFGINKMRLYVAGQNLMYIMSKDYTGYNPEGITDGSDNPLTYGYQKGAAPIYKTVSFGLNVEF